MAGKKYIAEGLPFEHRCKVALDMLTDFHQTMEKILEDDLRHLEERKKRNKRLTGLGSVAQKLIDDMFEGQKKLITDSSENIVSIGWKGLIESCRRICGYDATDFALKAVKHTRKGN